MTTEEELFSMRRSIRILRLLLSLFAAALVFLAAMMWRGVDEVRARSFTLLDRAGQPSAVLKNGDTGPALTLLEPGGMVVLGDVKGDIGLGVVSSSHETIMHLLLGRDGVPGLSLSSARSELGIGIAGQTPGIIFKTDDKMRLTITDKSVKAFDDAGRATELLPAMKTAEEPKP